jgi:hypothetical protein
MINAFGEEERFTVVYFYVDGGWYASDPRVYEYALRRMEKLIEAQTGRSAVTDVFICDMYGNVIDEWTNPNV